MSTPSLPQRFSVKSQPRDGATVVVVSGELDVATAGQLRETLAGLAAQEASTVLDLSGVTFLDSTGLKVIVAAARTSEETGWSFAVAPEVTAPVARLFELVNAQKILPFAAG